MTSGNGTCFLKKLLHTIKNSDDLEKAEELASLQNQVQKTRLRDKLSRQNFHEEMKESV